MSSAIADRVKMPVAIDVASSKQQSGFLIEITRILVFKGKRFCGSLGVIVDEVRGYRLFSSQSSNYRYKKAMHRKYLGAMLGNSYSLGDNLMSKSLFSMIGIIGSLALAWALKSHGWILENQIANPNQMVCGSVGGLPSDHGLPKGDIIPNQWSPSDQRKPDWLDRDQDETTDSEIDIRKALNNRAEVSFKNTPLSSVLQTLGEPNGIEFIIDEKGLEEESVTPEEPISVERKEVRMKDVLRQILEPLNLTTLFEGDAILVTHKKRAQVNRFYDLSFIFPDNTLSDDLISAIENTVAPDEWLNVGGYSSMSMVGSVLVVRATEETHEGVSSLLRGVAKQNTANKKPLKRKVLPETKMPHSP